MLWSEVTVIRETDLRSFFQEIKYEIHSVSTIGSFKFSLEVDGISKKQEVLIVPDSAIKHSVILGFDFICGTRFT